MQEKFIVLFLRECTWWMDAYRIRYPQFISSRKLWLLYDFDVTVVLLFLWLSSCARALPMSKVINDTRLTWEKILSGVRVCAFDISCTKSHPVPTQILLWYHRNKTKANPPPSKRLYVHRVPNYTQKRNLHSVPLHLQVPLLITSIIARVPTLASSVRLQLMQLRRCGIHLEDGLVVSFHFKGVLR